MKGNEIKTLHSFEDYFTCCRAHKHFGSSQLGNDLPFPPLTINEFEIFVYNMEEPDVVNINARGRFQRRNSEEDFRGGSKRMNSEEEFRGGFSMEIRKRNSEEEVKTGL